MILDATAGNRTMWEVKDTNDIIYIDSQTELEVRPTVFCSNQQTPFKDGFFDTIFYDPPHTWGNKTDFHSFPRRTKEYMEKWKDKSIPRYYGWDVYDNWHQLVLHLAKADKEFFRILKDDGLLWLKWNEMSRRINRIEAIFSRWRTIMRLYIGAPTQTRGKHQTYWLCMKKILKGSRQSLLV